VFSVYICEITDRHPPTCLQRLLFCVWAVWGSFLAFLFLASWALDIGHITFPGMWISKKTQAVPHKGPVYMSKALYFLPTSNVSFSSFFCLIMFLDAVLLGNGVTRSKKNTKTFHTKSMSDVGFVLQSKSTKFKFKCPQCIGPVDVASTTCYLLLANADFSSDLFIAFLGDSATTDTTGDTTRAGHCPPPPCFAYSL
jgi:hypothetical protein